MENNIGGVAFQAEVVSELYTDYFVLVGVLQRRELPLLRPSTRLQIFLVLIPGYIVPWHLFPIPHSTLLSLPQSICVAWFAGSLPIWRGPGGPNLPHRRRRLIWV